MAASLFLHGALILFLVYPATEFARSSDPGNPLFGLSGGGGGGGGGRKTVAYISLPAFTPPPPVAEEVVVPPVETIEVPVVPDPSPIRDSAVDSQVVAVIDSGAGAETKTGVGPGSDGGSGGGSGGGTGPGSGPGTGPGSGGSAGFAQPPIISRLVAPPENKPRELRGQVLHITFWIKADGQVERVEFSPDIRNRTYANKFREKLLDFRFTPARAASGESIPAQYTIEVTL